MNDRDHGAGSAVTGDFRLPFIACFCQVRSRFKECQLDIPLVDTDAQPFSAMVQLSWRRLDRQ